MRSRHRVCRAALQLKSLVTCVHCVIFCLHFFQMEFIRLLGLHIQSSYGLHVRYRGCLYIIWVICILQRLHIRLMGYMYVTRVACTLNGLCVRCRDYTCNEMCQGNQKNTHFYSLVNG